MPDDVARPLCALLRDKVPYQLRFDRGVDRVIKSTICWLSIMTALSLASATQRGICELSRLSLTSEDLANEFGWWLKYSNFLEEITA
jgi:hypothetical protein